MDAPDDLIGPMNLGNRWNFGRRARPADHRINRGGSKIV